MENDVLVAVYPMTQNLSDYGTCVTFDNNTVTYHGDNTACGMGTRMFHWQPTHSRVNSVLRFDSPA